MNDLQKSLARHALGLGPRQRKSYRNHYVGPDGKDLDAWRELVAAGDAREFAPSQLTGGDLLFKLNRKGAEKALNPGESLDPEDFPEAP